MQNTLSSRTHERGSAPIKAIIAFAVLFAVIYVAIVMIPIYIARYDLEDKVKEDILFANQRFGQDIPKGLTEKVYGYLNDMEAYYEKKNVSVKHNKSTKKVTVEIWYEKPHKLPFFPKQFYVQVEGKYGL